MNLRIPGPIPVPEDILEEMSRPMINHRGPEYNDLLLSATDGRQPVGLDDERIVGLSRRIAQSLILTGLGRIEDVTEFVNRTLIDG